MNLYHETGAVQIFHGDSLQGLPCEVDHVITDPPYSERTHGGHYAGCASDKTNPEWLERKGYDDKRTRRRSIDYPAWTPQHVFDASAAWHANARGWIVVITDHLLAPVWERCMSDLGRYVFAPLPFVAMGKCPRLTGDGPASWTCWIVVSRPKHAPYSRWGSLPGAYVVPPGRPVLVGGKPRHLMLSIVADYSREGDTVCDPCMGAGTTLWAAEDLGRGAVGIDISEAHCRLAAEGRPIEETAGQMALLKP